MTLEAPICTNRTLIIQTIRLNLYAEPTNGILWFSHQTWRSTAQGGNLPCDRIHRRCWAQRRDVLMATKLTARATHKVALFDTKDWLVSFKLSVRIDRAVRAGYEYPNSSSSNGTWFDEVRRYMNCAAIPHFKPCTGDMHLDAHTKKKMSHTKPGSPSRLSARQWGITFA